MDSNQEPTQIHDKALRPKSLDDFMGQPALVNELGIYIKAARQRQECLEHVLLFGPPGLGKTTLANIISNEMGGQMFSTTGPLLQKPTDLAPILVNLTPGSVLFIDEIHRVNIQVEEMLYSAMEDGFLDIMIGEVEKKSLRIALEPFTLIGATTRSGMLSAPMRGRFGMSFKLQFYSLEDLSGVIARAAPALGIKLSEKNTQAIAIRSRGTPRNALVILRRVRDYLQAKGLTGEDAEAVTDSMEMQGIDARGLNEQDQAYLRVLTEVFGGGPVGLNTLASSLGDDPGTLEDVIEPYLLQQGIIKRTARGRELISQPESTA
jgi:Holliday junction DNA helicase RuvB